MGQIYSIDDVIDMVRRRVLFIISVFFIGCGISVLVALGQNHLYRSSEVIQIVQPKIADDLAKSTVEGSAARRLQLIEQRLMTRDSVIEIIDKYGIYHDLEGLKQSELVALMRHSVSIEGIAAAREGFSDDGAISVLTISAEMPTALQAQQVAHEFAQRTIELSKGSRIEQARGTLEFFTAREQNLTTQITALEDEMSVFRNTNNLSLPGSLEFRREEIATINDALLTIARERITIQRAADEAGTTQRQATADRIRAGYASEIATLDAQRQLLFERKTELEDAIRPTPEIERQLQAFDRKLEQLRVQMASVSARRAEAEVGFRLESERQAERLTVIEPAAFPDYPITGSRKKLALMGGVASIFIALTLAYLLELKSPVIRTAAQMDREIGLKPVVSIPYLNTRPKRQSLMRRMRGWFTSKDRSGDTPA